MNDRLVMGGLSTVQAICNLYRKDRGDRWTRHDERNEDRILSAFGTMDYTDITRAICREYVSKRETDGMSTNTIRLELAHLRAAVRHAKKEDRIPTVPEFYVPSSDAVRDRWLDQPEFQMLMEGAIEFHVKVYQAIGIVTAARPSHILKLQWEENVDMANRIFDFRGVVRSKNKRAPRIPMNDTAYETLKLAQPLARSPYVIEFRGKPIKDIKKGIMRAAERAGLEDVTPYVLRHTAGVWMAKAGVSIEKIAEYMGHTNIETTRKHYAHYHPEFMHDAAKALEIGPAGRVQLGPTSVNKDGRYGRNGVDTK